MAALTVFRPGYPDHNALVARGPRPWLRARTLREYDFGICRVREDVFVDPRDGSEHPRAIIEAGDWANVVAFTTDGKVILVRQFRFGSGEAGLELPGGVIDLGETPSQAANRVHTFIARGCERVHDGAPDASEDLVIESWMPPPSPR